jgi:hypothetical protein
MLIRNILFDPFARAVMDLTRATSGTVRFIVSMSSNNNPSLALIARFELSLRAKAAAGEALYGYNAAGIDDRQPIGCIASRRYQGRGHGRFVWPPAMGLLFHNRFFPLFRNTCAGAEPAVACLWSRNRSAPSWLSSCSYETSSLQATRLLFGSRITPAVHGSISLIATTLGF